MRHKSDFHTRGLVLPSPQLGPVLGTMGDAVKRVRRPAEASEGEDQGTRSQTDPSANHGAAAWGKSLNFSEPDFPPLQARGLWLRA